MLRPRVVFLQLLFFTIFGLSKFQPISLWASDRFQPVLPEELALKSEPFAPGAPAIILYRQVDRDDNGATSHEDNYVRIKILTEEGRKYADVEIPFVKGSDEVANIRARTIRPDDQPFGFTYSFEAPNYTKTAGSLMLVRPRVIGTKAVGFLETNEQRKFPVEFAGPALDTDTFEITLPPGYAVDELPDPVNADYSFGSYHSKTEVSGSVIRYTRSFEIKELSIPASKAEELKKFNRMIAGANEIWSS